MWCVLHNPTRDVIHGATPNWHLVAEGVAIMTYLVKISRIVTVGGFRVAAFPTWSTSPVAALALLGVQFLGAPRALSWDLYLQFEWTYVMLSLIHSEAKLCAFHTCVYNVTILHYRPLSHSTIKSISLPITHTCHTNAQFTRWISKCIRRECVCVCDRETWISSCSHETAVSTRIHSK